jgi:hypothetical protein
MGKDSRRRKIPWILVPLAVMVLVASPVAQVVCRLSLRVRNGEEENRVRTSCPSEGFLDPEPGYVSCLLTPWRPSPGLNEFMLDTLAIHVSAEDAQSSPSAATCGPNVLIVWEDWRAGGAGDIFGSRIDRSGNVLDSSGIAICLEPHDQSGPSVAFADPYYLVVWQDRRNGTNLEIYGARLDTSGAVLDPVGFPILQTGCEQERPQVASDGSRWLVIWDELTPAAGYDLYGARVDTSGIVLDPSGIVIASTSRNDGWGSVAFDGVNYMAVWSHLAVSNYDLYCARVDTSGILLDPSPRPVCTGVPGQQIYAGVAYGKGSYLAAWNDNRDGGVTQLYAARVDTSGAVLDPLSIFIAGDSNYAAYPSVAFDGSRFLVVWEGGAADIYGSRVDTSGQVLDSAEIAISALQALQGSPCLVFDMEKYVAAWTDSRSRVDFDIYCAGVDTSGAVLDTSGILVSMQASFQSSPSAVFDGTRYFAVWDDFRGETGWDIYGTWVDSSGTISESSSVALYEAPGNQKNPAIAFDGNDYFLVWEEYGRGDTCDLYGARIASTGALLDTAGIPICTLPLWQQDPAVGYDGANYLVVWEDTRSLSGSDIYASRVDTAGTVLDPSGIAVSAEPFSSQFRPSLALAKGCWLIAWEDGRSGMTTDIYCARLDTSGDVLDSTGIAVCTTSSVWEFHPSLSFDGTDYFIVWEAFGAIDPDIWGARVDLSGTLIDTTALHISSAAGEQRNPSVAFDGVNHLVVWEDARNGRDRDLYGARVSVAGEVLDPTGLELVNKDQYRAGSVVVPGSEEHLLLVYEGFALEPYNSQRVFGSIFAGVGVGEERVQVPSPSFGLRQNAPNPFRLGTSISYSVPARMLIRLAVYDCSGRMVRTLIEGEKAAGRYSVAWDGKDRFGMSVPSGIYFCRMEAGEFSVARKIVLLR